eukprot:7585648-Lingulodinium_polyedra.AAC.1
MARHMIMELYTGLGDRADCSSHRDTALCDITGTTLHNEFCRTLAPGHELAALGARCGSIA